LKLSLDSRHSTSYLIGVEMLVTVVQEEFVEDVAIVSVNSGLIQAGECFFLQHEVWIDEGSYLLTEVDGLIHRNLSCLFLVLLKNERKCLQVFPIVLKVHFDL